MPKLLMLKCNECSAHVVSPPSHCCPHCGSSDVELQEEEPTAEEWGGYEEWLSDLKSDEPAFAPI